MLFTVLGLFLGDGAMLKVGGGEALPIVVQYHISDDFISHVGYVLVFYYNHANKNYYFVCCLVIGNRKFTIPFPSGDKIRVCGCSGNLRLTFTTRLPYTVKPRVKAGPRINAGSRIQLSGRGSRHESSQCIECKLRPMDDECSRVMTGRNRSYHVRLTVYSTVTSMSFINRNQFTYYVHENALTAYYSAIGIVNGTAVVEPVTNWNTVCTFAK